MDSKGFWKKCEKASTDARECDAVDSLPAHYLSPFLAAGKYDNSVDVYAFGILFWYICSGSVKLPEAFERCASKDHLWNNVRRGESHEPCFTDSPGRSTLKAPAPAAPPIPCSGHSTAWPHTRLNHRGIQKRHLSPPFPSRQHGSEFSERLFYWTCLVLQLPMQVYSSFSSLLLLSSNLDNCSWSQSLLHCVTSRVPTG